VTDFVWLAGFSGACEGVRTEFVAGPRTRMIPLVPPKVLALVGKQDGALRAEFHEVAEDGLALGHELDDAVGQGLGDLGILLEAVDGGGEDDLGGGGDAGGADSGLGLDVLGIGNGGLDGGDAAEGPLGVGELEGDAELVGVARPEAGADVGGELVVGALVFEAEDGGAAGVAPVFEAVHGGAEFALRGSGAADAFAVFGLRR